MADLDAAYFDQWYAAMPHSAERDRIQQRNLGLPPHLLSSSLLPWDGIADVCNALGVGPGDQFVDLACGRGGYGLEIAHRTGARLVGVDFSAVALDAARASAARHFPAVEAEFRLGSLTATGLADGAADGIMCIDAMQFAEPYEAGLRECARILAPGRPLVLTGWQAAQPDDNDVPARLRHDIPAALGAAGFVDITVREMTAWHHAEHTMWLDALATDENVDDEALRSMREEAARVVPLRDRVRRLLVRGRTPGAA